MNIYFCEKCGKRLTDDDLASGQAVDKELKGIYCAHCGDGVTTAEYHPVKPAERQEQAGKGEAGGASSKPSPGKGSGIRLPRVRPAAPAEMPPSRARGAARERGMPRPYVVGLAGGLIGLLGAVCLFYWGGSRPAADRIASAGTTPAIEPAPGAKPPEVKAIQPAPKTSPPEPKAVPPTPEPKQPPRQTSQAETGTPQTEPKPPESLKKPADVDDPSKLPPVAPTTETPVPAVHEEPPEIGAPGLQPGLYASFGTCKGDKLTRIILSRPECCLHWDAGKVQVDPQVPADHFGILYRGFLRAPKGGRYAFAFNINEIMRCSIDDRQVVAAKTGREMIQEVDLAAGDHPFRIDYFELNGAHFMKIRWKPPGESQFVEIPKESLWHDPRLTDEYRKY
jgi:DNA-directed RNA polymerase subunit RPC12/RpoP